MSHREILQSKEPPTKQVTDEAHKIINLLDGTGYEDSYLGSASHDFDRARMAREQLLKDVQSMSPKDSRDLLMTVMNQETKYKGYDLELFGHSSSEVKDYNAQKDRERHNLAMLDQQATPEQQQKDLAQFDQKRQQELALYKKEVVVELTRERKATDEELKQGYGIIMTGYGLTVAPYRINQDGLPDFQITGH